MAIMDITVDMCVIKLARKERISPQLSEILDEIDIPSFHEYMLPPNTPVELHYRDFDEYWLFREGIPTVTLKTPRWDKEGLSIRSRRARSRPQEDRAHASCRSYVQIFSVFGNQTPRHQTPSSGQRNVNCSYG